ncbi:MAG: glycosyltransferase [Candidatus Micrarchaeia archaeon]
MGKNIRTANKRPLLFLAFLLITIVIAYYSFSTIGYYWTVLIPNVLLLYVTTVLLIVYIENGFRYDKPPQVKNLPPVTVIIPSYNCKDLIGKTIESVKSSDYPNKIEIIVVDDGSTDGTRDYLKGIKGIRLILKEKNEGKAEALNYGVKIAKNDYVFCIDSDSYVSKNALRDMVSKMVADKKIGAVTCFVKVSNNKTLLGKVQEIEYFVGFGFSSITNYLLDAIFVTPGPMTLFRKEALLEVGLFDTNNITEDLEMAWRLRKNGYKISYAYEAVVYTVVPETFSALWRQRTRWYRGKLFNICKHNDMFLNPSYGHFGMFVMPFSLASELAAMGTIYFLAYMVIYTGLWNAQLISTYISANSLTLANVITGMFGSMAGIFMFLIVTIPWMYAIIVSHKLGNKKLAITDMPAMLFFIFIYSIFLSLVYVYSLFKEIYRGDYIW